MGDSLHLAAAAALVHLQLQHPAAWAQDSQLVHWAADWLRLLAAAAAAAAPQLAPPAAWPQAHQLPRPAAAVVRQQAMTAAAAALQLAGEKLELQLQQ